MKMISNKLVWGSGGHARSVAAVLLDQGNVIDFLIDEYDTARPKESWNGIKVLNSRDFVIGIGYSVIVGIGGNLERQRIQAGLQTKRVKIFSIVADGSIISKFSTLGTGSQIMRGAIISNEVSIGDGTIINSGAIIEHGTSVGTYSHISPGATLLGNCKVGNSVMVGANATIFPNVEIANGVIIGAGITVRKNIDTDHAIVKGPLN
jgi:sugar O-acyltransferase (sialic acid O-acetyltransferase NeuD family)